MKDNQLLIFSNELKSVSETFINKFIAGLFITGLLLANCYYTWSLAIYAGGCLVLIYAVARNYLDEIIQHYLLSAISAMFMIQFTYQMHGLPEMHYFAFFASTILITFRNWKLQVPLAIVITFHHLLFYYLQLREGNSIYFANARPANEGMLLLDICLSLAVFSLCGFWSYYFNLSIKKQLQQRFEIGMLQEDQHQKKMMISMSESLRASNKKLKTTLDELANIFNTIDEVLFSVDMKTNKLLHISPACEKIYGYPPSFFMTYSNLWQSVIHPSDKQRVNDNYKRLVDGRTVIDQYRIIKKDKTIGWVEAKVIPTFDRNGNFIRKDGIIKDISERKLAEETLRESSAKRIISERLMKTAEKLAKFGSWQLDVSTSAVNWSDGAFQLYGYAAGEIQASYELFLEHVHPEDVDKVKEILQHAWEHLHFQKSNFRIIDRNGKLKYIQAEFILERDESEQVKTITGFKQDITEKTLLENKLAKEILHKQKAITDAAVSAQEEERSFMGEELHDNINPILATVKLYLDCAVSDEKRRLELIGDARGYVTTAMNEIRNLSKSVLPPSLGEVGLINSLNDLVANIENVHKLAFETHWENVHENELCNKLQLTVYRIVQEQINNVLKHSGASKVKIKLHQHGERLQLSLLDDGSGFDSSIRRQGVGIQNIIHRAELFNGKVEIISHPGKGCELKVDFINKEILAINQLAQAG
ncbi:MAG: PAS domain-containing protein [Bacteroidetes bacterium]|nr:PAS domain-containing protein [Bacteroidota bacterium]